MKAALDKMPRRLVERIRNLDIKHDGTYDSGGYVRKGLAPSDDPRTSVGTPHPVVIRHPVSGDRALYLGRRRNAYIMGLALEESERLLDEIWSYAESAVYKHRWRCAMSCCGTTAPPCIDATPSTPSRAA